MSEPKRIQLQRTKGWRKPEGAVVVSRPTKWRNPFCTIDIKVGDNSIMFDFAVDKVPDTVRRGILVAAYRRWMVNEELVDNREVWEADLAAIRGLDLACWCPLDQPCHADVLLELANKR
jgi:uncharacterized protein DUF4326